MTNTQTLKIWGFYEKDGWLCSPLIKEEVFQLCDIDQKDMKYIIEVISASSYNAGVRWQREHSKAQLISQMEDMIETIKNG